MAEGQILEVEHIESSAETNKAIDDYYLLRGQLGTEFLLKNVGSDDTYETKQNQARLDGLLGEFQTLTGISPEQELQFLRDHERRIHVDAAILNGVRSTFAGETQNQWVERMKYYDQVRQTDESNKIKEWNMFAKKVNSSKMGTNPQNLGGH